MPNSMKKIIDNFIDEVKEILGKRLKKILLYGSYARGDYNKNSDIDIMILTDLSNEEIEKYREPICNVAFDIEIETGYVISPL